MKWNAERSTFTVLLVAGTVLWIPLLRRMLGGNRGFLSNLGFASGPRASAVAWVLALAVAVFYAGYTIRNIVLVRRHWLRFSLLKAVALVAAVGAAVVEEAFFRRVLMDWLMSRGAQPLIQIMLSGIAFGAAHGTWGMHGESSSRVEGHGSDRKPRDRPGSGLCDRES